jgi:hypothetical protein
MGKEAKVFMKETVAVEVEVGVAVAVAGEA